MRTIIQKLKLKYLLTNQKYNQDRELHFSLGFVVVEEDENFIVLLQSNIIKFVFKNEEIALTPVVVDVYGKIKSSCE